MEKITPAQSFKNDKMILQRISPNCFRCLKIPVYKLTVDNLQMALIDVLIRQFLNTRFSQSSVAFEVWLDLY